MGLSIWDGVTGVREHQFESSGSLLRPVRNKIIEGVLITHLSPGELTSLGYLWNDRDTVTTMDSEWVFLDNKRTDSSFRWKRPDFDQVALQIGITLLR